jgi:hypothetical protein
MKSVRAFSMDAETQSRLAKFMTKRALTSLLVPPHSPSLAFTYQVDKPDSMGLLAADYAQIYEHIKAPEARRAANPATLIKALNAWNYAMSPEDAKMLQDDIKARKAANMRAWHTAAKARRAMPRHGKGDGVNLSRVVCALLMLGMNVIEEGSSVRAKKDVDGSQDGDASQTADKLPVRKGRGRAAA